MSLALTAIFSFLLGLLVAGMGLGLFMRLCEARCRVFIGAVIRSMAGQGISTLKVMTLEHGWSTVGTADMGEAVERALSDAEWQQACGGRQ